MVRIENLSESEQRKIYNKLTKKQIVDMLVQCNKIIEGGKYYNKTAKQNSNKYFYINL